MIVFLLAQFLKSKTNSGSYIEMSVHNEQKTERKK